MPGLSRKELVVALERAGFLLFQPGVKTQKAVRNGEIVYLKQETENLPLVVSQVWEEKLTELGQPGVYRPSDRFFYHNSSMVDFERRVHTGREPIPFGLDFGFRDSVALERFLEVLNRTPRPTENGESAPGSADLDPDDDPVTESEVRRAARIGQAAFRQSLLDRDRGRCVLTGIEMPEILRASHIVPWRDATPRERLDPANGLLLAVHIDALFDRGLLSFRSDGTVLCSGVVSVGALRAFGLTPNSRATLHPTIQPYLLRNRQRFFPDLGDQGA